MKKPFDYCHRLYDPFMRFTRMYRERDIADLLECRPGDRIIDIGGGTGHVAAHLAARGLRVVILDESRGMLSHAPPGHGVNPVCGDALAAGFRSGVFRGAILSEALHHIPDHERLMTEIRRLLAPGGHLVIYDFDLAHPLARVSWLFETLVFGRVRYRRRADLTRLLERHGFEVGRVIRHGFAFVAAWRKTEGIPPEGKN